MSSQLPQLNYKGHEKAKLTLHLFLQIIGKIRLMKTPRKNHWWYVTEYLDTNGFTTGPIPFNNGMDTFKITMNTQAHQLELESSEGKKDAFTLSNGLSVASFYQQLTDKLNAMGIEVNIKDKPYDLEVKDPFGTIEDYHHYDPEYTYTLWKIMLWVDGVFKEFSGRFYGKTCPVHLYWHSMDLAVTRFSGRKAPPMDPGARISDKDAYTHECISFGFWAGDNNMQEPAFYSYTYPSPNGLGSKELKPESAQWVVSNGSPMAILTYDSLRKSAKPREELLAFMESAYQAGAKQAGWDVGELSVPALKEL